MDVVSKTLNFHTSVNYQVSAPPPFNEDVHVDIIAELERIRHSEYKNDCMFDDCRHGPFTYSLCSQLIPFTDALHKEYVVFFFTRFRIANLNLSWPVHNSSMYFLWHLTVYPLKVGPNWLLSGVFPSRNLFNFWIHYQWDDWWMDTACISVSSVYYIYFSV